MLARFSVVLAFLLYFAVPVSAEPYTQNGIERWVDGVLAELKKAGASEASRGLVTYDPQTGALSIADIKAKFPQTSSADEKADDAGPSKAKSEKKKSLTRTDDDEEDDDNDKNISKKADNKKSDDVKNAAKNQPVFLTIPRITATNLKADGANWKADRLRIESMSLKMAGNPGALTFDTMEFNMVTAPQVAASVIGQAPGEQVAAFLQQASFESGLIPKAVLVEDEKDSKSGRVQIGEISIRGYVAGKATEMTMAESSAHFTTRPEGADKDKKEAEPFDTTIGTSKISNFDIGLYADLFLAKPKNAGKKDQLIYSDLAFSGLTMSSGKTFSVKVNPVTVSNARLDIPQKGLMALYGLVSNSTKDETTREKMDQQLFETYSDWMGFTNYGSFESQGLSFKADDTQFEIKAINGKDVGRTIGQLAFLNFSLDNPELKAAFDSVNLSKVDTTTFYKAMFEEMARNKDNPDFKSLEGKLPTFGLVEVNSLTLQSKDEPALLVKRISFELTSWVKFVPENLRLTVEKMVFPAEAFATLESPNLKDLDYKTIEFNSDTVFALDMKAKTASLSPFKFDFGQAGHLASEMHLSNISESMLGASALEDPFTQLGAAKFEKFRFQMVNGDFMQKYIAWKVKSEKKAEAVIKDQIATTMKALTLTIPDEAQQKKAQEAIDTFIATPQSLTLVVTPKTKLSLLDLQLGVMTGGLGLLDKVNFELVANSAN